MKWNWYLELFEGDKYVLEKLIFQWRTIEMLYKTYPKNTARFTGVNAKTRITSSNGWYWERCSVEFFWLQQTVENFFKLINDTTILKFRFVITRWKMMAVTDIYSKLGVFKYFFSCRFWQIHFCVVWQYPRMYYGQCNERNFHSKCTRRHRSRRLPKTN